MFLQIDSETTINLTQIVKIEYEQIAGGRCKLYFSDGSDWSLGNDTMQALKIMKWVSENRIGKD